MAQQDAILKINWQILHGRTFRQECPVLREYILTSARAASSFTIRELLQSVDDPTAEGLTGLLDIVEASVKNLDEDVFLVMNDMRQVMPGAALLMS
uniref:Terpene_synth_C domain-containing protein n=1 Tax=Steinernema glaseri TaxID=37863 RepID=A0A1I7Y110_9BILA